MSRQIILLKTVQEALGKEKNNQTKQNILGCSFTSLKNTTGNPSAFSGYACKNTSFIIILLKTCLWAVSRK